MNELNAYGVGMSISRTINGKRVNLSRTKKSDQARQDMVVEMSARHARLLVEQDWIGMHHLACEYRNLGAMNTYQRIMLEIPADIVCAIYSVVNEQISEVCSPDSPAKPTRNAKPHRKRKDSHL